MNAMITAEGKGVARGLSRWLHPKRRTRIAALIGGPAMWMIVLYIGSLLALFIN